VMLLLLWLPGLLSMLLLLPLPLLLSMLQQ
jgi:hypothetical protein